MANETSKALARRIQDPRYASQFFVGCGIDIGSGRDSLAQQIDAWPLMLSCYSWDWPDGDAQLMPGCPSDTFQFIYSSHCLEHVRDPRATLARWWEILRPGGHLICQIPDEDLYEAGRWPSTWNPDHKSTFAVGKKGSWSPVSINIDEAVTELAGAVILRCERLTEHYRYDWPRQDQTQGLAECAIEIVARKDG